ncbi:MAG: Ig-like domain repeat protein, partial [Acidobacteriota bacterium]
SNQNISNQNISNPDPAVQYISNQNISNQNISNQNISNQNISNQNISNTTITDATYAVTNSGNTTHSYRVALYGSNTTNTPLQLIVTKNYSSPASVGCALQNVPQTTVLANVNNALVAPTLAAATDPNIPDGTTTNATMALAPGETAFVTLRGALTAVQMAQLTRSLTPVITAHGKNSNGSTNDYAMLLFIQTTSGSLPAAVVGVPYSYAFTSVGGSGAVFWTSTGTLPTGLTLASGGLLSGTPSGSGSFTFTVTATDGSPTPQTSSQSITMTVAARATTTGVMFSPNPATVLSPTSVTATVADAEPAGTMSSPGGLVTFSSSVAGDTFSAPTCSPSPVTATTSACSVTLTPSTNAARTVTASYGGSAVHAPSTSGASLTAKGNTTTTIASISPSPFVVGYPTTVAVSVAAVAPAAGMPTGTVVISDGSGGGCTATLAAGAGSCSWTPLSGGSVTLTATYGGDALFNGSATASGPVTVLVYYAFTGFLSPLAAAGTESAPTYSGSANLGSAVPLKWQLRDSNGNFLTSLATTTKIEAVLNSSSCTAPVPPAGRINLYSPATGATGGSSFKYDTTTNQFRFNWDTSYLGIPAGCYDVILTLADSSPSKVTSVQLQ